MKCPLLLLFFLDKNIYYHLLQFILFYSVSLSSDKPLTPVLTSNNNNPVTADDITLFCTTSTTGITSYEFRREGTTLIKSASNSYRISGAQIGRDDGSYTCVASVNTVASDPSAGFAVTSEFLSILFVCLIFRDES